jgi:DNA-binding CsgD family transcriptional regulator
MRKSDLLRLQDVRDAYRLIGECRDLGHEPALWQMRMFAGLCRLVGADKASGGEGFWQRETRGIEPLSSFVVGHDAGHRKLFAAYLREITPQGDPILRALADLPGRVLTRTRTAVVPDATWYKSADFNYYRKPAGIDHCLASICEVSAHGAIAVITLHRGVGDRDFSPGEVRLLEFFHEELGRLVGRQLVSATETNPDMLSPRLRHTLACLVQGDSEKQAAARLGLSPTTVHEYVTALYRRFGVRSRGELLAHVMRRAGRTEWRRYTGPSNDSD